MNPLNDHPGARKVAYYVQFVVAGVLLLLGIGFGAADVHVPTWYVVAAAVANGAWTYLGLTAAQNVPSYRDVVEGDAEPPQHRAEDGESPLGTAVLLALLVLVVVLVVLLIGPHVGVR